MSHQFDSDELVLADSMHQRDQMELIKLVHDNDYWPRLYWVVNVAIGSVTGPMSFAEAVGLRRAWRQAGGYAGKRADIGPDYETYLRSLSDAQTYRLALAASGAFR